MKQFINTQNNLFTFSSCDKCEANCCNGKKGTTFAQIILEDFKEIYKNFPILFIFGELGYLKPVVILTNGKDFCKYLDNFKCLIYEKRPSICKVYPLSSNIDDNIYIDELCPAVNDDTEEKKIIIENSILNKTFDYPTLNNYQDKYIQTFRELDQFNNKIEFSLALIIKGIQFYKFNTKTTNKYMQMHQKSLIHLKDKYFIDLDS